MKHYIGLDVSLKSTFICILNEQGKIAYESSVATCPDSIHQAITSSGLQIEKIALETGGTSHWLTKELINRDLPVICIDARKMAAAISIRVNKTDKNDAREIANAVRTGYYREVYLKEDLVMEKRTLLTARRLLINQRTANINCIKGILKAQGQLFCGSSQHNQKFIDSVMKAIEGLGREVQISIKAILKAFKAICLSIDQLDDEVEQLVKNDEKVKLLQTIPGVGPVTALTFVLEIGDPRRFKKSRSVGAYVGMTPKQYSSGEVERQGSISKAGSEELRMLLAESAMCMMYRTQSWSRQKVFGLKIKKKHGHKKAVVALGRKLAVIMHKMLVDNIIFEPGNVDQKEIEKLNKQGKQIKKTKTQTAKTEQLIEAIV